MNIAGVAHWSASYSYCSTDGGTLTTRPVERIRSLTLLVATVTTLGCDDTALEVAREAADRQAEQNLQMAALHDKVAEGAKRLVEEEAKARQTLLAAHRDLHGER